MPNVMIRRAESGALTLYVAKKDLEEAVVSVEQDTPQVWGGELALADGTRFYVQPQSPPPKLPLTVRAKRL
jgi:nitrogen fixation protein NifT